MSSQAKTNRRPGSKDTIRRVLALIAPYRLRVALVLVLAAVTVASTLYAPILSGRGVDLILGPDQVNFPGLVRIGIQLAITIAITAVAQWLMSMMNNRITFQVVRDIRVRAFSHMEELPLSYIDAHRPGETISRMTSDV